MNQSGSFRSHMIGIILVVLAFLLIAFMNALGKFSLQTISVGMLLFAQNFWALCFTIPFLVRNPRALNTKRWGMHILRAATGLLSFTCLFVAVKYISLVDATLLANSAPLFLPFVIWVWFGQKISKKLWACLIIGFIGVFFIVNPTSPSELSLNVWMVLVALAGGLFSAITLQSVRNLGRTESPLTIVIYYFLIATVATAPFAIPGWKNLEVDTWLILIAIGALLASFQFLLALAYKYATPVLLGPFNYTVVIFSGLIEWAYWKVIPKPIAFLGIVLITLGGVLVITQLKAKQKIGS